MNSNFAAIWERLSDRTKLPRRLWYPPPPPTTVPYDAELWQKQFDDVCTTVRRSMFGIVGYAAFCLVALGQPDAELLREAAVQLPIVNTKVSIAGFMIIGPLVLVGLSAYLHIFIGRWVIMISGKPRDRLSPSFIFNLPSKSAAVISAFLFYWLPPIVWAAFIYKGQPYIDYDIPILSVSVIATILIVWLAIRRCPDAQRKIQNPVLWLVLLVLFIGIGFGPLDSNERSLNLRLADLSDAYLRDADLIGADLIGADLTGADLTGANLTGAHLGVAYLSNADLSATNLTGADLSGAKLSNANLFAADLTGADLIGANLTGADLTGANLSNANLFAADLSGADLIGADLTYADLTDADLTDALGLYCEILATAKDWQYAFRDSELACGEPIPEPPAESNGYE